MLTNQHPAVTVGLEPLTSAHSWENWFSDSVARRGQHGKPDDHITTYM